VRTGPDVYIVYIFTALLVVNVVMMIVVTTVMRMPDRDDDLSMCWHSQRSQEEKKQYAVDKPFHNRSDARFS